MAYDYDKLYGETRDALGEPTSAFVDFFDRLEQRTARVLDLGCGQGRDAIFIARKRHQVVAVDISSNGIRDLKDIAAHENLPVECAVADIVTYQPNGLFDVILIDRTLHMLAALDRNTVLERSLDHVRDGGWILIADEASNMKNFKAVIAAHAANWNVISSRRGYLFLRRS